MCHLSSAHGRYERTVLDMDVLELQYDPDEVAHNYVGAFASAIVDIGYMVAELQPAVVVALTSVSVFRSAALALAQQAQFSFRYEEVDAVPAFQVNAQAT